MTDAAAAVILVVLAALAAFALGYPAARLTVWLRRLARRRGLDVAPGFNPDALPFSTLRPADFTATVDQGNFGEGLTSVLMAAEGWRTVNGKPGSGPQGLDGVFLRAGRRGWEGLIIETKTNAGAYRPASMRDEKIIADLQSLWVAEAEGSVVQHAYGALIADINSGALRTRKALWRHMLETGETLITPLGPDGEPAGPVLSRDNRAMFEALSAALREFDRARHYQRGR